MSECRRKRKRRDYEQEHRLEQAHAFTSPTNSKGYNGGLLCCAEIKGQLHILCGSEFRNASRLTALQRSATSHNKERHLLQLVVPGGRHKRNESVLDTVVREFWEETGRIVDRMALLQCLYDRSCTFEFSKSRYELIVAMNAVHCSLPQVFAARVLEYGYPSECLRQLYWLPWKEARRAATHRETLRLKNDLEPKQCQVAFSGFTTSMIGDDKRVLGYLDDLDSRIRHKAMERLKKQQKESLHSVSASNRAENSQRPSFIRV